jgi:peroxiredoxin
MPAIPSVMLPLQTLAPDFALPNVVTGETVTRDVVMCGKKGLLVMFICRHCPYVVHVQSELARLGRDYDSQELAIVAISSNDAEAYPEDAPDKLAAMVQEQGFVFPLCYDETQDVARAYDAACTPDFFLFDAEKTLVYRGQLDDSRPGSEIPVTGADLRAAIEALLSGQPISSEQKPSLGCSIKWKGE